MLKKYSIKIIRKFGRNKKEYLKKEKLKIVELEKVVEKYSIGK